MIAGQQHAVQAFTHEIARRREDAGLGAPEAVDALLRVADDEHRRRPLTTGAAARADVPRQPGMQRVPLQRAGVLELVDQQVTDLAVQPFLHPARQVRVAEQGERTAFQVVHVDDAALALEPVERVEQRQRQRAHLLVPQARPVLVDREQQPLQSVQHRRQRG